MQWYELERPDEEYDIKSTRALGDLEFRPCFSGPLLHPHSAVVGHRVLGESSRETMKELFDKTIKEAKRWNSDCVEERITSIREVGH